MDILDLVVKIMADDQVTGKIGSIADNVKGTLGGVARAAGAAIATTVVATGAAATAVGKQAFDAYANYEQLEGGVKKLYGDSAEQLMQYANEAYRTSGMSANQYMEQATSFSAALVNSLGGDTRKAAEQTDVAMRAISDNVNTFGSDMSSVQNAFQGFSKQNYTIELMSAA